MPFVVYSGSWVVLSRTLVSIACFSHRIVKPFMTGLSIRGRRCAALVPFTVAAKKADKKPFSRQFPSFAMVPSFALVPRFALALSFALVLAVLSFAASLSLWSGPVAAEEAKRSELGEGFQARRSDVGDAAGQLAQNNRVPTSDYGRQVASRNSLTVSIISGDVASTYLRMAADLANVLDSTSGDESLRVVPVVGKGGVQNVLDVLFLRGIDMGIIQQGQLSYLSLTNPDLFQDIKKRIHFVTKLYNAEFHVLARRNITSLRELADRKVSLGKRLGSTDMIGRTVFSKLDIGADIVNEDLSSALSLLETGQIDAVGMLGGAPVEGFTKIRNAENYHFLPITPQSVGLNEYFNLVDEFLPTKITHDHYPELIEPGQSVSSIASSVILVVYNWKSDTKRYKKLATFVDHFFTKFEEFRRPARHPKWHEVSIHAKIPGMERFEPANDWLKQRQQLIGREVSAGEMKVAMDVFVRQYSKVAGGEEVTPLQRDDIWAALARIFGRYWEAGVPKQ